MRRGQVEVMTWGLVWGLVWLGLAGSSGLAADPFADAVVSYSAGVGAQEGFTDPQTVLGSPERFTGEGSFPSVVSMFSSPFGVDELVSLGDGGSLVVKFDEPVTDDAGHGYGVDLIVFGNTSFIDADWPQGWLGTPAATFSGDGGMLEVSTDGVVFYEIPGVAADGLFPTQGYTDVGPFDEVPGVVETDFARPMDPALTLSDFDGLAYGEALLLYDGSGGGTMIDLAWAVAGDGAPAGLTEVSYVRVSHAGGGNVEIDAFAAVPEPASLALLALGWGAVGVRRGRPRSMAVLGLCSRAAGLEPQASACAVSRTPARLANPWPRAGWSPRLGRFSGIHRCHSREGMS